MSSSVPLGLALLLGLAPSVVAVVAIVANEFRDRRRLEHEREQQLREEQLRAYSNLARLTLRVYPRNEDQADEVSDAYSAVELLSEDAELQDAATSLWAAWYAVRDETGRTLEATDISPELERLGEDLDHQRNTFLELARRELRGGGKPGS